MWSESGRAKYEGIGKPYSRKGSDKQLSHCQALTNVPWQPSISHELLDTRRDPKVSLTVCDALEQCRGRKTVMPDGHGRCYSQRPHTWSSRLWQRFLPHKTMLNEHDESKANICEMYR
ncbi:hypothetical protein BAUCODRAFT_123767 [Baudoinia panamericana UAMH 10762]|uniref:Uncharacterized protein n=1 Tax=Baudoinia panamericana (strain UAMH 10762) TaxID=717646 RepID=M2MUQ6_BAUPA|nr:uncharacterized protein BAUCODRAFT_123767 [Baudoinia panamericana UAMH 10762]EMC95308.1 hypothetical protein BAUCODRAFT_123767 [Baudoinia panamericana UAMH 10762]